MMELDVNSKKCGWSAVSKYFGTKSGWVLDTAEKPRHVGFVEDNRKLKFEWKLEIQCNFA